MLVADNSMESESPSYLDTGSLLEGNDVDDASDYSYDPAHDDGKPDWDTQEETPPLLR